MINGNESKINAYQFYATAYGGDINIDNSDIYAEREASFFDLPSF